MTELPPPTPRTSSLPRRRHFYDGYGRWHWAALIVGIVLVVVLFGPAYIALLTAF